MFDLIARPWALWLLLAVPFIFLQAARSFADRKGSAKLGIATARSLICIFIILELTGTTFWWERRAGDLYVAYLVDVSDSVTPELRIAAQQQVLAGISEQKDRRQASLVFFGETSETVVPFGEATEASIKEAFETYIKPLPGAAIPGSERLSGRRTDISRAISLALAGFPGRTQKKIVLLTDGNQTDGDLLRMANVALEQNVQICPVPLINTESKDVIVAAIDLPERIKREEAFEIKAEVRSAASVEGRMRLYIDDYLAETRDVELRPGKTIVTFRRSLEEGGGHLIRVHFDGDFEQPTSNDSAYSYISVPGRPGVLVVSNEPAAPLIQSLRNAQFRVDLRTTIGAPRTMLGLIRYDAIMLENVSAGDFGENRLRLLRDYVNEFGGGLVLVGGRNSFKAGGYAGTALEEASPLAMDISAEQRPSTSVILALDDSRSMWLRGTSNMTFNEEIFGEGKRAFHGISTPDKAQFMKDVFKRVVLGLSPRDRIGAVGMSSELMPAIWYIRPQRVTDKDRLVKELEVAFSRRTYSVLYPTLDEARFDLFNDAATYKQVLLLTDGFVASDSNYRKFAMMLLSDGVSLSTVGVGGDSNERLLEEMARWGGGQFYLSNDLKKLGDVYEKELNAPTKQLLVERPVSVAQINESPLTKGLDMNLAPALFGYVRTRPKASSNLVLTVEGTSDPLLASWSYGAGKVVAFTSSAVSSWATLWVRDWEDGYSRFWRQQVRGVLREPGKEVYRVHLKSDGLRLKVSADVIDSNENFINGTQVEAKLFYLGERGDVFSSAVFEPGDLLQTAPGRYEHEFTPERKGVYLVSVRGKSGSAGNVETTGTIMNISKEHLNPIADSELLAAVAQLTKGRVTASAVEALRVDALKERRRHDLGYYTTILACLLLVIEILIRRWPAIAAWYERMKSGRAVA